MRETDYESVDELASCLRDVDVVVSALAGLDDVIVGAQGRLVRAASMAGVSKFVPSDFSIDYRRLPVGGGNRNLDMRREFHERFKGVACRRYLGLAFYFRILLHIGVGRPPRIHSFDPLLWPLPAPTIIFTCIAARILMMPGLGRHL